jgi:hypothetical protein
MNGPQARGEFNPATRFLTVTGILFADNRLLLEPGFVTDDPADPAGEGEEALVAEVAGETGDVVLRHKIPAAPFFGDGEAMAERSLLGKVPLPDGAHTIRFLRGGIVIHELELPRGVPNVRLDWSPEGTPTGTHVIRWSADDPEGRPLRFLLAYSNDTGRSWRPLSLPSTETAADVDFDRLPGGTCRIAVLATNGGETARAESSTFRLPKRPCWATILSPEDGSSLATGQEVTFQGQGYYLEERRPELTELEWNSSRDGQLGTGPVVATELSQGAHEITLLAGTGRRRGSASIQLRVEPPTRRG